MDRGYLRVTEAEDYTTIIQTSKPNYFKKIMKTGAVLEQGITVRPIYNLSDLITEPQIESESMNKPNLPYLVGTTAFIPFEESQEAVEIYKGIKKLSKINGELNINELESLGEKIKFVYNHAFYNQKYDKKLVTLKQVCFYCWIVCGVLNTLQGKALLYTLNYLCAVLQLDLETLFRIVQSSSVSNEKKEYILNSLNSHGVKSEIARNDNYYRIELYTKQNESDAEVILSKTH